MPGTSTNDGIPVNGAVIIIGDRRLLVMIAAELYHPDRATTWTWDGRGTPFPSNTLDYQLYGPSGLEMRSGFILDTEQLPAEVLEQYELEIGTVGRTGSHRPLVVEYGWK